MLLIIIGKNRLVNRIKAKGLFFFVEFAGLCLLIAHLNILSTNVDKISLYLARSRLAK